MRIMVVVLVFSFFSSNLVLVSAAPVKIMPLGDSITYQSYSYREKLFDMLTNAGYDIDFVGSQSSGSIPDKDNEGHPGWSTYQLTTPIVDWMQQYSPDVVLLHIGTNDVNNALHSNSDMSRSKAALEELIDSVYRISPSTYVLVATTIPSKDCWQLCGQAALTKDWNVQVRSVVSAKAAAGIPVYLVDMETEAGIDVNIDLSDAVHVSKSGADKMADTWYNSLRDVFSGLAPNPNPNPNPNPISEPANALEVHNVGEFSVNPGETFEVGMSPVDDDTGETMQAGFSKYLVTFQFDSNYLEFDNAISNNIFSDYSNFEVQTTANTVTISESSNSVEFVSDAFAQVRFRAKNPIETTNIYLTNLEYWTNPLHEMSDFGRLETTYLHDRVHIIGDTGDIDTGTDTGFDFEYIENVSELPDPAPVPDIVWQHSGDIHAWIDIVGFRGMLRDNGIDYINGDPEELVMVQHDAYGEPPGIVDSIEQTISYRIDNNTLYAILHVSMDWHVVCCDEFGCYICGQYTDTADFQDSEIIPAQYNNTLPSYINITEYNFSLEPKFSIPIPATKISQFSVRYNKNSFRQIKEIYHVEQTAKGVFFGNATKVYLIEQAGNNLSKVAQNVIIKSMLDEIDYSALNISISDFYNTSYPRYNISRIDSDAMISESLESLYNPVLVAFVSLISIFILGIIFIINRRF